MTQEIGMITTVDGKDLDFSKFPIGSLLYLYPYHVSKHLTLKSFNYTCYVICLRFLCF